MKKTVLLKFQLLMTLAVTSCVNSTTKVDTFTSDWNSLKKYQCPDWFRDAKFGIYFHWGVYSVPAYKTEWYSHYMYVKNHTINKYHVGKYGPLSQFGYKNFIPMFKAEKFNPDEWADLFLQAGARFAGPVAEHADGFAMWDSDLTKWDAVDMGPERDIVGELEKAIRKKGLKFITTLHHQWLYAWYPTLDKKTDASDPAYAEFYGPPAPAKAFVGSNRIPDPMPDEKFSERWLLRAREVVDKYRPDLVWFDNKLHIIKNNYITSFLSHYYNSAAKWNREVVATYKSKDFAEGAGILDLERSRMSKLVPFPWLTDDSIDWGSWCDVQEPDYKTTDRLIDTLVDIVSKNGCLLLNITPKANGEIPMPVQERLMEMGNWLQLNGEAIYETRPWKIYGEGPTRVVEGHLSERKNMDATARDIRFTTKGDKLYAIALGWPDNGIIQVKSLGLKSTLLNGTISAVRLLGSKSGIKWERKPENLEVHLPEKKPCDHAFVLVFNID